MWDAGKTLIVEGNADITANQFFNNGTIEFKNNLDLNLVGDFDYINHYGNATTTNEQDFRIGGDFIYDDDTTKFVWKAGDKLNVTKGVLVTTDSFDNAGNISAGSFIISTLGDFDYINHYGNTTAANLDFRIGGDFFYEGGGAFLWSDGDKLKVAGNVNINTTSSITNSGDIDVGMNINATADKFLNTSTGNITADTLTFVSLGDFDFGEDFVNNGVINATIKIESTNVFVFNDINKDFVLNDNFSISGNFFVTADNYLQHSDLNISGNIVIQVNGNATLESEASIQSNMLSIQAANFSNQGDITSDDLVVNVGNGFINTGSINVNNGFDLSVAGDFDYNDDYGNISAATLDFNVGGNFSYDDNTTNFVWNAGDSLTVLSDAAITATQFTNNGAIDFKQKLTLNLTGDFDYSNYENTNTSAESLDLDIGGNFSYDDNTTNFVWNAGDSLTVSGNASVIADSYTQLSDINVSGNVYIQVNKNASIDSGASIQSDLLSLQAVEFSNRGSVTSANVAASVDNFNNAIDATVSTGNFATEVKNFNNSGTIIVDNLGFAIDGSFDNEGSITATNSFNVSVENNFRNSGSINSPSLYVSAGNRVDNYGDLDAADFLIIEAQGDINNSDINNAANISSISLFINGYGNFTNDNSNIDIEGASVIHAGGEFSNSGNITAEALGIFANEVTNNGVIIVDYLDVSADTVNNTGDITTDVFDITTNSFTGNNINIR